ncbi:hypothetical protein K7W42_14585 [Deinococcus sp. HMF7604]|uniref:hypothetical protein n=1 Tax=Deinococcus betulae TaxID=2873312 RepID=UPI001CCBBEE7|nr:hypothetical protein [Deinococcus betulae]MBZ9752085.1 hypothetical protein [Deinococcus betulae]
MSSRALHRALWTAVPLVGLALLITILLLSTPDQRPPREVFEALCERSIRSSPDVVKGQTVRAVTLTYNTRGGQTPEQADFAGFSVSFLHGRTVTSGFCRLNGTGTDVILSELNSVRF